ncbi:MAG TPA: hypothetical protein VFK04_08925 [Gemmatimonadaceae bacterium]|nr:hypothetical protein [Gemmatimonadaceae bacterium]
MENRSRRRQLGRGSLASKSAPAFTAPVLVAVLLGATALATASAQDAAGRGAIARTFEINARRGRTRQFEDGYRRHLDWHTRAGDRWAWYMWTVTNGERAGLYVDGTFGHTWADFDAAVDPPGDRADNGVNVDPFTTRGPNHVWRRRPELGGLPVDLEEKTMVLRTEYHVRSGAREELDAAFRRLREVARDREYDVFELLSGGERSTYVLWVPVATWSDAGDFMDRTSDALQALAASAESTRAELWRFRADMSICRSAASKCHGTVR